jgi:hypothetical protein
VNPTLEAELFRRFVGKNKARFVERVQSEKQRPKIWDDLRDTRYLDARFVTQLSSATPEAVGASLKAAGFGQRAYVLSPYDEADGTVVDVDPLLQRLGRVEELIAYCSRSQVALFKTHEGELYLLQRGR